MSTEVETAPRARRMPKGAERDPSAQCYISAPGMRRQILEGKLLKPVTIRDGGKPILVADVENEKSELDTTLDSTVKRTHSHLNLPREDTVVGAKFDLIYIDGTVFDKEVQIVMKLEEDANAEEVVVCEKAEMDGNKLTLEIERPVLAKGFYRLIVKVRQADGSLMEDTSTSVFVE